MSNLIRIRLSPCVVAILGGMRYSVLRARYVVVSSPGHFWTLKVSYSDLGDPVHISACPFCLHQGTCATLSEC